MRRSSPRPSGIVSSPSLAIAYDAGGRLLKFGGDALLLLFTGIDHEARACQTAYDMRRKLREVGRMTVLGQRVTLRMSIGVNSGQFDLFLVGASHRELIVTGPAASTTVSMEGTATAGEIVVSEQTAAALSSPDLGPAKGAGRLLRRRPAVTASPTPRNAVDSSVDLSRCIPVAILDSALRSGHEPEHRRVTVAFLHFDGTDAMFAREGAIAVADYLDHLVTDVQEAVDAQDITFLGTDIDHDGGKVILVAGAPSTSGDDEHRMLLAVRQILDRDRSPSVRVGVNRGPVFAGDIGPGVPAHLHGDGRCREPGGAPDGEGIPRAGSGHPRGVVPSGFTIRCHRGRAVLREGEGQAGGGLRCRRPDRRPTGRDRHTLAPDRSQGGDGTIAPSCRCRTSRVRIGH